MESKSETIDQSLSEEDYGLPFFYNVISVVKRQCSRFQHYKWNIIEKGSIKTPQSERRNFSLELIDSALSQIKKHIVTTKCTKSSFLSNTENKTPIKIFIKDEAFQSMGSVKTRGVIYTLLQLSDAQREKGVIAASTGSFATILCHYGHELNVPVTVVMPKSAATEDLNFCQSIAARCKTNRCPSCVKKQIKVITRGNMTAAFKLALHIAKEDGLYYLDGNDNPDMIIGQATMGLELINQLSDIDAVILPTIIDGCGLTTGIATVIRERNPNIRYVFEVQPEVIDCLVENIRNEDDLLHKWGISEIKYPWYQDLNYPKAGHWFDETVKPNQKEVDKYADVFKTYLKNDSIKPYVAVALFQLLHDIKYKDKLKRVVICQFGKIDSSKDLTDKPSSERCTACSLHNYGTLVRARPANMS
ncbi:PREDICTED: uncharacterized protein LOC105462712 [Wasmannia auropunctata]|uniref:uncharacterized protein LOC105462712 n=1 Tax=Wasmannia auropunctata TaxID=64793 RepID=UPI0005ED6EDB|nr:PREDICTED: uncharacterized protein LOC105462712 [Wasmannia auropunctata]